ncbi:unnamed protein product, partial [Porites evermanni]
SEWEYDSGESDLELTSHSFCGHPKDIRFLKFSLSKSFLSCQNTKEAEEGIDEARYFNEKLTGKKRIKEPNTGGMAQEEKPAGREREGKKRRTAAQVHDFFSSKMQCQIKYFL